jgi:hypothetical protein
VGRRGTTCSPRPVDGALGDLLRRGRGRAEAVFADGRVEFEGTFEPVVHLGEFAQESTGRPGGARRPARQGSDFRGGTCAAAASAATGTHRRGARMRVRFSTLVRCGDR